MRQLDGEVRQLVLGPRPVIGLNRIARHQHRPEPPRLAAADVARLNAVARGQRADDRAMLAMGADGDDDGVGFQVHRAPR